MNTLLYDKWAQDFSRPFHESLNVVDSSLKLYQQQHDINQLVLASTNPKVFFDATLWLLDHHLFCQFPVSAYVPNLNSGDKQYIASCPIFHIDTENYLGCDKKPLSEQSLADIWSNLQQPWQQISAQFAQLYSLEKQPWALGLNSWLYRHQHDDYFSRLFDQLSQNYQHSPWTQYFTLYFMPMTGQHTDFSSLSNSMLGPYARNSIANHWLNQPRLMNDSIDFSKVITQAALFQAHSLHLITPLLIALFRSQQSNESIHQYFSTLISAIAQPSLGHQDWITYQIGQSYLTQNFNGLESLLESFQKPGMKVDPLGAVMMEYLHNQYGLFKGYTKLIEYYTPRRA